MNNEVGPSSLYTHDGHKLSMLEAKFIDFYIKYGIGSKAVKDAGYSTKNPSAQATKLLSKDYISSEIDYQMQCIQSESIASGTEILQYWTRVLRNEEKDQFGLDAPLAERTKASQELARRIIDEPHQEQLRAEAMSQGTPNISVTIDWTRDNQIINREES